MRQILQIARTELKGLFCSPVAWILLVVFIFQMGYPYLESFRRGLKMMALGQAYWYATDQVIVNGLFKTVQQSIYLYLPLLTMGLMSNEYASGSIKLLYSSPINNASIILGKFFSVLGYGLALLAVICCHLLLGVITIPHLSYPVVGASFLGFALLFAAYAAIGVFISCLSSYQIVSAVATFALFAALNFVGEVGQDIPVVRDITYWLCMKDHTEQMIHGLICSADVIYFVMIIITFLLLSVIILDGKKSQISRTQAWLRALGVVGVLCIVGVATSRPTTKWYADVTETKLLTLSEQSQQILNQLSDKEITITTYVNIGDEQYSKTFALPNLMLQDESRFDYYRRFLPHLRFNYVYYYKNLNPDGETTLQKAADVAVMNVHKLTPIDQIPCREELERQRWIMTRMIEIPGTDPVMLNVYDDLMKLPDEREITAAMAVLAGEGKNISLSGRNVFQYNLPISEPHNRMALCNQGFAIIEGGNNGDLWVAINPKEEELQQGQTMLNDSCRNALILVDAKYADEANKLLESVGIHVDNKELRQTDPNYPEDLIQGFISEQALGVFPQLAAFTSIGTVTMPGATTLDVNISPFKITPLLCEQGTGRLLACVATRMVDGREQRVVVMANASVMSNREMNTRRNGITAINQSLFPELLFSLGSEGKLPLQISRPNPTDTQVSCRYEAIYTLRWLYLGLFPLIVAVIGIVVIILRKRN